MIELDGGFGEGGGQILRTALALSSLTGEPFRMVRIRAGRPQPGLRPQHLAVVRAFERAFRAEVDGAEPSSASLAFTPGVPEGGDLAVTIPTAGSLVLAAQALLPALANSGKFWNVHLTGGTDVPFAPTWDYLTRVHLRLLERLGLVARPKLVRRGHTPRGGGGARLEVEPSALKPLALERGPAPSVQGRIALCGLPDDVGARLRASAIHRLGAGGFPADIAITGFPALDPGVSMALWADWGACVLGADGLGEKGMRAEALGERVADALLSELSTGATVDAHGGDQLMVWAALAGGSYVARDATPHARTNADVIARFLGPRVHLSPEGRLWRFSFTPSPVRGQ